MTVLIPANCCTACKQHPTDSARMLVGSKRGCVNLFNNDDEAKSPQTGIIQSIMGKNEELDI